MERRLCRWKGIAHGLFTIKTDTIVFFPTRMIRYSLKQLPVIAAAFDPQHICMPCIVNTRKAAALFELTSNFNSNFRESLAVHADSLLTLSRGGARLRRHTTGIGDTADSGIRVVQRETKIRQFFGYTIAFGIRAPLTTAGYLCGDKQH